ncbi:hypothetical protein B0H66DRAFT_555846 [Apodospora peruviana]|uniref:Oxidoreductase n=1 Tax=Apodospora peruviana TaxID=516989 RepID=A0AAE0I4C9_9PEZI|nr:hypothetical protein B0H66DRAFT_555846 [Apodospora peruviana]
MDTKKKMPDSYWDQFIATSAPAEIAKQILKDAARLDSGEMPSQLAMHLPRSSSRAAGPIAAQLAPSPDLHPDLNRYLYDKIRDRLRKAIEDGESSQELPTPADGYFLPGELVEPTITPVLPGGKPPTVDSRIGVHPEDLPTSEQVQDALKVLRVVQTTGKLSEQSTAVMERAIQLVEAHFACDDDKVTTVTSAGKEVQVEQLSSEIAAHGGNWNDKVQKYHVLRPPPRRLRACYICRFVLLHPHPLYKSMCRPCGAFNYAASALSLPHSLNLNPPDRVRKTALVTGARINLGYRVALRLLRCGGLVIATTRYPHDAAVRYSREHDFEEWRARLKVVGADFRVPSDAFAVVHTTKAVLREWGAEKLHILVNNAAQTLTDSVKKEQRMIALEEKLVEEGTNTGLIVKRLGMYQPRVWGGVSPLAALYGGGYSRLESAQQQQPSDNTLITAAAAAETAAEIFVPDNVKDDGRAVDLAEPYFKSSWVQALDEIPYEDVVFAHVINAFVPFILCRELLPLMGEPRHDDDHSQAGAEKERTILLQKEKLKKKPLGHIINVSAREGIFEKSPDSPHKGGKHVHTNMAKAALNMITQTEAPAAWRGRRVAMNTVDPGYLSAAPEIDHLWEGERPLSWEDGAGRVLWPVAIGEVEGEAVWGRYLKHYGVVSLDSDVDK